MRISDLREVLDLCYSSVHEPAGGQFLTEALARSVGADAGDIVFENLAENTCTTYGSLGFDPGFLRDYDTDFLGANPWFDELSQFDQTGFHSDGAFSPGYRASPYFNEWVRPQGLENSFGAVLEKTQASQGWVGFVRATGSRPFGENEKARLDQLLPHVASSISLRRNLQDQHFRAERHMSVLDGLNLPALLLDGNGKVVEMNAEAEGFLAKSQDISLTRTGRLLARKGQVHASIGAQIYAALDPFASDGKAPGKPVVLVDRRDGKPRSFEACHWTHADGLRGAIVLLSPLQV